jgi:FkbM family methyltransferase
MRRVVKSIDNYTYLCYANDTISNSLSNHGYWENNLIKYAETHLKDDSVILDIGANIGTWSIPLAIKQRKIYAFEPYDSSFNALCGNIFMNEKEPHVYPRQCALTDNVSAQKTLILPEICNQGGCKLVDGVETLKRYEMRTIDSFCFERVDFIKLDVEGHELNVIRGGVETISRCKPVIFFECWDSTSTHWNGIPNTHHELMAYVELLGYVVKKVNIDGCDNYEAIPVV